MSIAKHERPNKGASDIWITPKSLVNLLGDFETDPCSHILQETWIGKKFNYTINEDGLSQEWHGRVWMNPPYSKNMEFGKKFKDHGNGIALVFARTETEWFYNNYSEADAYFFIKGRLTFLDENLKKPKGNSGAPSVLIAFGSENVKCLVELDKKIKGILLIKNTKHLTL